MQLNPNTVPRLTGVTVTAIVTADGLEAVAVKTVTVGAVKLKVMIVDNSC